MNNETLAYNPDDWEDGAGGLKHYGYGIVDKDGAALLRLSERK